MKVVVFAKRCQRQHLFWHCPCVFFFLAKLKKVEIIYFIVGNNDDNFTLLWKDVLLSIVNSKYKKPGTFLLIVLF